MRPSASSTHLIWAAVALAAFSAGYYLAGNSEPRSGKAGHERGTDELSATTTPDAAHLSQARSLVAGESKQGAGLTPEQIRTRVAVRHRRYGVKAEHLRHAKEAMLAALGETLQDEFDAQSRAAWTQVIEWIGTVMQRVLMTSGGAQWGQSSGQSLKVDIG
jgi:hypothetical protein